MGTGTWAWELPLTGWGASPASGLSGGLYFEHGAAIPGDEGRVSLGLLCRGAGFTLGGFAVLFGLWVVPFEPAGCGAISARDLGWRGCVVGADVHRP